MTQELTRKETQDGLHLLLETNVQDPVGLVNDEALEVLVQKGRGVLQVVKQAAGSGHDEVDALGQLLSFRRAVRAAHDEAVRVAVVLEELGEHAVRLDAQLARRRDDYAAGALKRSKMLKLMLYIGAKKKGRKLN